MYHETTSLENYIHTMYDYLRPCASGATVKNIKNTLGVLEMMMNKRFDICSWEGILDIFINETDDEEINELKTNWISEYKEKSLKKLPKSKITLAKEIWKMKIANALTFYGIFQDSPTLDPIPDEISEDRYHDC